jgi:hypothetical protein
LVKIAENRVHNIDPLPLFTQTDLEARRPLPPSPFLVVDTPKKFPGGFTSPTRDERLGARGILRDGDLGADVMITFSNFDQFTAKKLGFSFNFNECFCHFCSVAKYSRINCPMIRMWHLLK